MLAIEIQGESKTVIDFIDPENRTALFSVLLHGNLNKINEAKKQELMVAIAEAFHKTILGPCSCGKCKGGTTKVEVKGDTLPLKFPACKRCGGKTVENLYHGAIRKGAIAYCPNCDLHLNKEGFALSV